MIEFQATKIVKKTRKEHQCCICNRTIPKRFSCWHATGRSEGDFFNQYLCNTCWELQLKFPDSVSDWWEGYWSNDTFSESCSELEVATPLQLLNKLNENYNKNLDKLSKEGICTGQT